MLLYTNIHIYTTARLVAGVVFLGPNGFERTVGNGANMLPATRQAIRFAVSHCGNIMWLPSSLALLKPTFNQRCWIVSFLVSTLSPQLHILPRQWGGKARVLQLDVISGNFSIWWRCDKEAPDEWWPFPDLYPWKADIQILGSPLLHDQSFLPHSTEVLDLWQHHLAI